MAIIDEIEIYRTNLASAYNVAESKGATIPVNRNMENLPPTLASIPTGGGGDDNYKALLDGSLTSFKVPAGVTTLKGYRFYDFKNLKEVDLTGITEIPDYLCFNCGYIEKLTLDKNTTKIGKYAFRQTGNVGGVAGNFEFHPVNSCYLGSGAFSSSKLTKISGEFNYIGSSAIDDIRKLTDVNVKINGEIGQFGFSKCSYVKNFYLDPTSVITKLDYHAFERFGDARTTPENNIFEFDFRNSVFTQVGSGCFRGTSQNICKYSNIQFPVTLNSILSEVFMYTDHFNIYFNSPSIPTIQSNTFSNMTNNKIFVPYNSINAYKTATNWTTVADIITGFVNENTLEAGYVLPTTNDEGLNLKWYSNVDMTNAVTAVGDTTIKYYCKINTEDIIQDGTNLTITSTGAEITQDGTNLTIGG